MMSKSNVGDFKRHYYLEEKVLYYSQLQINYLDSIVNLCKENSVKLFFISEPVHANYKSRIPKKNIKEIRGGEKRLQRYSIYL